MKVFPVLLAACISIIGAGATQAVAGTRSNAILVTGASSGIGLTITEKLSAAGFTVYAGARKPADMDKLNKLPHVQAVQLDVTSLGDIEQAIALVQKQEGGLDGLINNAGVGTVGMLADMEEKDVQDVMQVNVYGMFRVTQAALPLLRARKGRIINIGSVFGTSAMPLLGAYSMSKHAVEAYTDTLAEELNPDGIDVTIIEPGTFKSEIYRNAYQRFAAAHPDKEKLLPWQQKFLAAGPGEHDNYPPPDKVAVRVLETLNSDKPPRRILVVPERKQAEEIVRRAIRHAVQLNSDAEFKLTDAELIQILQHELHPRVTTKKAGAQ